MKYINNITGAIMESNCSCFGSDWKLVDDVDVTDKTNEELDTAEELRVKRLRVKMPKNLRKIKILKKEIQNE